MPEKGDDSDHVRKHEAGHPVNDDHEECPLDLVHHEPAVGKCRQFIDNLELGDLDKEITAYWSDPEFLKLVEDPEFMDQLRRACEAAISRFKPSAVYTADDLAQDVLARFGKWFPKYRGDAQPTSLLRTLVYNQLVDVSRKRDNQCASFDEIEAGCRELMGRRAGANRNHVAASQERRILVKEVTSRLTDKERDLFKAYFELGKTTKEIAEGRGVSKQAVSKQLCRVVRKLKAAVDCPGPAGGDPVTVGSAAAARSESVES